MSTWFLYYGYTEELETQIVFSSKESHCYFYDTVPSE